MDEGSGAPVAAGLAIGITFVVVFSVVLKPDFMLTDEELISKYSDLAEVKYFLEKYPDAKVEVNRNPYEEDAEISFTVERQIYPSGQFYTGIHSLTVWVLAQPYHPAFSISCGLGWMSTAGELKNTGEIDSIEQWCFQTAATEQQLTIAVNS
ncbi:MAG TPA: hypothetical protein VFS46_06565, partial [Nitrososphaera sp.]|nr:hypothetical protein [Nitrososphaera sp.]